jgi:hypothetical protein
MKAIRPRPEEKERRKKGRKEETETECRKIITIIFSAIKFKQLLNSLLTSTIAIIVFVKVVTTISASQVCPAIG